MIFLPIWTDYIFLIAALFNRNRRVKTPDSVDTMITSFQAIIPLRIDSIQCENRASLVAQMVKRLPAMRETRVQSLGWEDPLEKEMATHSSTLAWKIPWTRFMLKMGNKMCVYLCVCVCVCVVV